MLNNKNILITGGTGSFGQAFTAKILKKFPRINKIIIFSRDEFKQNNMSEKYNSEKEKKILRFFLGDIRDVQRSI